MFTLAKKAVFAALLSLLFAGYAEAGAMHGSASGVSIDPLTQRAYVTGIPAVYTGTSAAMVIATGVTPVTSGCALPPTPGDTSSGHHVWYSAPASQGGSDSNDGSYAHPFDEPSVMLADATGMFSTQFDNGPGHFRNTNAPVKPGDTLYLKAGNYAVMNFQGDFSAGSLQGFNNSAFITIATDPLAPYAAIVAGIKVTAGKMAFRNLTLKSLNLTGDYGSADHPGTFFHYLFQTLSHSHDIFVDGNHFSSTDDGTFNAWTLLQMQQNKTDGIDAEGVPCTTLTNNTFRNIGFGITEDLNAYTLVAANSFNRMINDCVDYASNHELIVNNDCTNFINDGDGFHRDGFQGVPPGSTGFSDVEIANNVMIRESDKTLQQNCTTGHLFTCPATAQGVDEFDGQTGWQYVFVHNNVVTQNGEPNGITYFACQHCVIDSNFLAPDDGYVLLCGANDNALASCGSPTSGIPTNDEPYLSVGTGKGPALTPSDSITITNNYVSKLTVDYNTTNITALGNTCWNAIGHCLIAFPAQAFATIGITGTTYTSSGGSGGDVTVTCASACPFSVGNVVQMLNMTGGMATFNATPYTVASGSSGTNILLHTGSSGLGTIGSATGTLTTGQKVTSTVGSYPAIGTTITASGPGSIIRKYDNANQLYDFNLLP